MVKEWKSIICVKLCCFMHVMTAYKCCRWSKQLLSSHMYASQTNDSSGWIYIINALVPGNSCERRERRTFWFSYGLDSLLCVCKCVLCAQIQKTCMKEESAKNFGATNSRYLTENVQCVVSTLIRRNYFLKLIHPPHLTGNTSSFCSLCILTLFTEFRLALVLCYWNYFLILSGIIIRFNVMKTT